MKITNVRLTTVAGVLACLLAVGDKAFACTCQQKSPPSEALAESVAVFSGEVIGVELPPLYWEGDPASPAEDLLLRLPGGEAARLQRVTVSVHKVWKGENVQQRQLVYSAFDCCMCGFAFEAGKRYIIYTYEGADGRRFFTSACLRTANLDDASADLDALPRPLRDFDGSRFEAFRKTVVSEPTENNR